MSALKFSALQQLRDVLAQDLAKNYPEQSRVSVYLDVDISTFVLLRAKLYVDAREPILRNYSKREAGALLRHSEHRILRDNFEPGKHHLRIEYTGEKRGAQPEDPILTGSIELDFEAKPRPQAYVLPVEPRALQSISRFFGKSKPKQWEWDEQNQDPRLGLVRFLRDVDLTFAAAQELLEVAGSTANPASLPAGYYVLLAHTYIDFGMRDLAAATATRAAQEYKDIKLIQTPGQTLADAWLRIAALDYARADYARAAYVLEHIEQPLSPAQRLYAQDIQSRVLLAQGEYAQAAKVLAQANKSLDKKDDDLYLPYLQTLYVRYNYAVALIRSGRVAQGQTLLDRIGQTANPSQAQRAIRDEANLNLAYEFLRAKQGASAKSLFQRVSLHSGYSNAALLGLGWTELAPIGENHDKASPGTFGGSFFLGDFEQAELPADDAQRLKRAVVAWQELAKRNPDDPAVQEALLSTPYALEELGMHEQAYQAYDQALNAFVQTKRRLQGDAQTLREGRNTTALFVQYTSSGIPKTRSIEQLITSHEFNEYLQNYQDFQRLQGAIVRRGGAQSGLLNSALAYAAVAQARAAQKLVATEIDKQLERMNLYEAAAIYGVTRYYDRLAYENKNPQEQDSEPSEQPDSEVKP